MALLAVAVHPHGRLRAVRSNYARDGESQMAKIYATMNVARRSNSISQQAAFYRSCPHGLQACLFYRTSMFVSNWVVEKFRSIAKSPQHCQTSKYPLF